MIFLFISMIIVNIFTPINKPSEAVKEKLNLDNKAVYIVKVLMFSVKGLNILAYFLAIMYLLKNI